MDHNLQVFNEIPTFACKKKLFLTNNIYCFNKQTE